MKRILLVAVLAVVCTLGSFAQNKSVVGKWKLVTLVSDEITFDMEHPENMKKELIKQFEASGAKADSAMIEMMMQSLTQSLGNMVFDFGADGKLRMSAGEKSEKEESYTVDYEKGTITSKSPEETQNMKFRFEKENLVLIIPEGGKETTMILKKIK